MLNDVGFKETKPSDFTSALKSKQKFPNALNFAFGIALLFFAATSIYVHFCMRFPFPDKLFPILLGCYGIGIFWATYSHHSSSGFVWMFLTVSLIILGFTLAFLAFEQRDDLGVHTIAETQIDLSRTTRTPIPNMLWGVFFAFIFLISHLAVKKLIPKFDPFLLPLATFLSGIGLIMLYRLSPDMAIIRNAPSLYRLFIRQFVWLIIGLAAVFFVLIFANKSFFLKTSRRKYIYVLFSVLLIALTGIFGKEINGRRLWLNIGPITIQSVEIVKIALIFFIAGYFNDKFFFIRKRNIRRFQLPRLKSTGPFLLMWVLAILPVFLQKDLGPTFLLFAVFLAMFYAGSSTYSLLSLGTLASIAVGCVCYFINQPSIVRTRIDMWLTPFSTNEGLAQSIWAISSGGMLGTGLGKGMPHYIPVVYSDFSFAAICEELGFIGGLAVLFAYLAIIHRSYLISVNSDDRYNKLLAAGIMSMFAIQSLIIIAGVTRLIPLTGITLPFISYGGTSIIVNFVMIGLLMRLSEDI